jgi:pimeloyl-ACP methyl ester carboxylesterase
MPHKITHREYGHGPILVLLHGYGGSVMHWDGVVERLKDSYRVVVPNLSHLYLSKNRLLFPVILRSIAEYLRVNFPGEKFHFAGTSFGAALAWGLSIQNPELVDRLVLLNPLMPFPVDHFLLPETKYFFVMPMSGKAVERVFATPIGQSFLKSASEIFRPDRASAERSLLRLTGLKLAFVADIVSHFAWILRSEDWKYWAAQVPEIKAPKMVIWSKDDLLFNPAGYSGFADLIQADRRVELPMGGHVLSKSRPDEIAILISEFLAFAKNQAA